MSQNVISQPENGSAPQGAGFFTPPSLPKGGGTLTGSGGALQAGGPDGVAGWSIPLPVSAGRGFAPELALSYSSAGGNSEFGLGWQLPVPTIRRDTRKGVPKYDDDDIVLAPDGTYLLRHGEMRQERLLPFSASGKYGYNIIPYISRFGGISTRYECWTELVEGAIPFWIQFFSDGGLALYGWTAEARLSDGDNRVAEWRLDEQMTARGEHIVWAWRNDNHGNLDPEERSRPGVNRYLSGVYWGNKEPALHFLRPVSPEKGPVSVLTDWHYSQCGPFFWLA
ncbi:SpvB/TcaC N-terminal domain-containing protein [Enterobacter sp. 22466]|uniref:SpvB/TcaC N-terminal domain-containing protein n=1 Tax=Enterobacter sp. 22466 TaxID=3453924 RepID=UPI003F830533